MAERLMAPVREQAVPVQDAGFGEQFVGYEPIVATAPRVEPAPPPAVISTPEPFPAPEPEADPEPPPVPEPPPLPEPATEVRGPFLDRIARFRDWLHHHFQAVGVFILDREGTVIFDESGHGKLHFLARSLAISARRPGGMPGNVHVKVGASATLEVVPADTPYGRLVLGAVVPAPLDPDSIDMIMEALRTVATPQQ